ncbi:hypothetical protein [Streptomyces sp. NPDC056361]|uniref:hypothetical protein n=1 Tax=Streptomyces sp. NPDC056361 TaxID=3345795 RepID=UPI0035DBD2E9
MNITRHLRYGELDIEVPGGPTTGGRITRLPAAPNPRFTPRAPVTLAPPPLLLGRREELRAARDALAARRPVEFYGPCGIGKTTLLQAVAADATGRGHPAVVLRPGTDGTNDLLRRAFAALHRRDNPWAPTPGQCADALSRLGAVLLLDDVTGDLPRIASLVDALPGCAVVLGAPHPLLGRAGTSHPLSGLPDPAARALLAHETEAEPTGTTGATAPNGATVQTRVPQVTRVVAGQGQGAAARFVDAVEGRPLSLRQGAALVREGAYTFDELTASLQHDPRALDRLALATLTEGERRVLSVLALLAGPLLPGDLLTVMCDADDAAGALRKLRRHGLAEEHDDRFGLPACRAESYRDTLLAHLDVSHSVHALGGWLLARDPTSDEAADVAGAALSVLSFVTERRDWPHVITLVRAVQPVLALKGRWEAWNHVLTEGIEAARAWGDPASEALFTHQQGLSACCDGRLDAARTGFEQAAALWDRVGDAAGAETARHNIAQLRATPAATAPSRPATTPSAPPPPPPPTAPPPPSATPSAKTRPSPSTSASTPPPPSPPAPHGPAPSRRNRKRRWTVAAACAAAVLAAAIALGALLQDGDSPPGAPAATDRTPSAPPTTSAPPPSPVTGTYARGEGRAQLRLLLEPAGPGAYRAVGTQDGTHGTDVGACEQELGNEPVVEPSEAVVRGDGSSYEGTFIQVNPGTGGTCRYLAYDVTLDVVDRNTVRLCPEESDQCLVYQRLG